MSGPLPLWACPEGRCALSDGKHVVPAQHTPRQNHVLAALPVGDFEHDGPLPRLLLRYLRALIAQIGQIAVCNRHHSLDQRLCRWILSCLDRLPSNELTITQEMIANMLGVRREGVTEAAGRLQEAGLIHYHRGHIAVLDRPQLEAQACECYAVVKRAYGQLLRPENSIGNAGVHGTRRQHRSGCEEPADVELT